MDGSNPSNIPTTIWDNSCIIAKIKNNKYNFSNARLVRNLTEKIKMEQANRIIQQKSKDLDLIIADDITAVVEKIKTKPSNNRIGFTV